jgi:chorismate mutase/prephenate dehydratase
MTDAENQDALVDLRKRIDQLDAEILEKLNERAACAIDVADVKLRESQGKSTTFYRPEREAQVLRRISQLNQGPLTGEKITLIYRHIMSACLALEEPLKVAYLGPEGTFTQMATFKHFGEAVFGKPLVTVDDVFREVSSEACHYGVVPVENSTEGVISHTLDNFLESNLHICGEITVRVHHHLMIAPHSSGDIKRIYSHQQTLAQCRVWLNGNYPNAERVTASSNAEAAKIAAGEQGSAAIAGQMASEIYNLNILSRQIEDQPDNTTRFIVVGRDDIGPSGDDKTSIVVSTRNQPGALYEVLEPFNRHGVSMTSIETRPSRAGIWSYVFFIDFDGHREDELIQKILGEIDDVALGVKMLGSYPRAIAP